MLTAAGCGTVVPGAVAPGAVAPGAVAADVRAEVVARVPIASPSTEQTARHQGDQTASDGGTAVGPVVIGGGAFLTVAVVALVLGLAWLWLRHKKTVAALDVLVDEHEDAGDLTDERKTAIEHQARKAGADQTLDRRVRHARRKRRTRS